MPHGIIEVLTDPTSRLEALRALDALRDVILQARETVDHMASAIVAVEHETPQRVDLGEHLVEPAAHLVETT